MAKEKTFKLYAVARMSDTGVAAEPEGIFTRVDVARAIAMLHGCDVVIEYDLNFMSESKKRMWIYFETRQDWIEYEATY